MIIRSWNASEHFPQLKGITPRPEPNYDEDPDAWEEWNEEYQVWGNVKCTCQKGYFCRRHGEWVTGADIKSGNAPYQNQEGNGYDCPPNHYGEVSNEDISNQRDWRPGIDCRCSEPCPPDREDTGHLGLHSRPRAASQSHRGPAYVEPEQHTGRSRKSTHASRATGSSSRRHDKGKGRETPRTSGSSYAQLPNVQPQYSLPSSSGAYYPNADYRQSDIHTNEFEDEYYQTPNTQYSHAEQQPLFQDEDSYHIAYAGDDTYTRSGGERSGDYYSYGDNQDSTAFGSSYANEAPLDSLAEDMDELTLDPAWMEQNDDYPHPQYAHPAPDDNTETFKSPSKRSTRRHTEEGKDKSKSSDSRRHKSHSSKDSSKRRSRDKR